ncbi:MAG: hypothetical protein JNK45_00355 [Myxococcales bacterium]|nr:hypothetical protein [Myxococcales bacterium]
MDERAIEFGMAVVPSGRLQIDAVRSATARFNGAAARKWTARAVDRGHVAGDATHRRTGGAFGTATGIRGARVCRAVAVVRVASPGG